MKKIFVIVSVFAVSFTACDKNKDKSGVFKGQVYQFQQGKAWTWVELDSDQKPVRAAIAIDAAAMSTLDPGTGGTGHDMMNELSLQFPEKVNGIIPFKHALLGWNPNGHEPAGVYDKPHFDFHFYMTTSAEREAIPVYTVDSLGFINRPAADYIPANHVFGAPVPMMGLHWLDVTSPELGGGQFTQTFIYGSYNGKVTFYEPMITKAFLDNNAAFERSFPVPAKFQQSGYYPTKMRIEKKDGVTNVILENFVYRQQS